MGLEISCFSDWGMENLTCSRRGELVLFNLVKLSLGGDTAWGKAD